MHLFICTSPNSYLNSRVSDIYYRIRTLCQLGSCSSPSHSLRAKRGFFRIPVREKIFPFCEMPLYEVGPNPPPIPWAPVFILRSIVPLAWSYQHPHLAPRTNEWSYISTSPYMLSWSEAPLELSNLSFMFLSIYFAPHFSNLRYVLLQWPSDSLMFDAFSKWQSSLLWGTKKKPMDFGDESPQVFLQSAACCFAPKHVLAQSCSVFVVVLEIAANFVLHANKMKRNA